MSEQPRTAAGRALLAEIENPDNFDVEHAQPMIAAIEAEAADSESEAWDQGYAAAAARIEAQARPAVASEGLRAALQLIWIVAGGGSNEDRSERLRDRLADIEEQARAALVSDTGSVGEK